MVGKVFCVQSDPEPVCPVPQPFWGSGADTGRYFLAVPRQFQYKAVARHPHGRRGHHELEHRSLEHQSRTWPVGPRDRVTSTSATIRPGSRSQVLAGKRSFLGTLSLWGTDNDDLLRSEGINGSPSRRRMPVTSAAGRRRVLDDRGDLNDADRLYASVLGDGRPRG